MTHYSVCNDPDHSLIQDYVRDLLGFYGFMAKKEDWVSSEDRIDVTATGKGLKIGVEVHIKGDLDRDIQKLSKYSFDLAFIVGKDIKEGVIEVGGKKIYITDYRLFESRLREVLNENRPKFKPFYEWCMERLPSTRPPIIVEDALTKFKRSLTNAGLDNFLEDCLNTLAFIYMAEECCVMYDSRRHIKTRIIDEQILSILRSYNLVWDHARGSGEMRKYFISLTEDGKKIARQIISERISRYSKEIDGIISRFGKKIAYIITVGSVESTLRDYKLEFDLIKEEKSTYSESDDLISHPILRTLNNSFRSWHNWSPVFSFCRFMTYTGLYEYAKKFFEELRLIGLAVRMPSYGSYGQYYWDSYKSPKEVADYLLNKLMDVKDELRPLVEEYTVILAIYKGGAYMTRQYFDEVIKAFNIPIESIKAELEYLHRAGITSRYIPDEKATPFIVLNKDAFKEYLLARINELTNKVLQSSRIH